MEILKSSETRKLSLHPLAIHTFIKAQAGSLGKALSEAVMNSLDAFAGTVNVTLDTNGFTICDDGQGFQTREEIEGWFETLGFPHDEGNHRVYGKFGMGRAQMWAFASTVWVSNDFTMTVDVKKTGLDYELAVGKDSYKGTKIQATFYAPLTFQEQTRVRLEFLELVRFVPGLVTFNETVANKSPSEESWDIETPQAWMKFDASLPNLSVYNAGLLVSHFPKYKYGCGGVVVTKPEAALSLNLARNEILESECLVWKNLSKQFPKAKSDYSAVKRKDPKLSNLEKEALCREVKAGVLSLSEAMKKAPDLVTSLTGRGVSYDKLTKAWSSRTVIFSEKTDELSRRVSKLKLADVYDKKILEMLGVSAEEFKALVINEMTERIQDIVSSGGSTHLDRYVPVLRGANWVQDASSAFPELAAGKKQFSMSELDSAGKATFTAWQKTWSRLSSCLRIANDGKYLGYGVSLGDSPTDIAWIDESTKTFVLRKKDAILAMEKPMPELTRYALERLSNFSAAVTKTPGAASELFIRLMTATSAAGEIVLNLSRFYAAEAMSRDLAVPKTRLAELDALGVE
jgi:hypothetical protein